MFTLIYNPTSGGRKAYKTLPKVERLLQSSKIEYRLMETVYPPKAEYYKSVPCTENDTVCVMGGDGTVLDVLNILPDRKMTLMYIPCGTGNDFIKTLHLPRKPIAALRYQLNRPERYIDYCTVNDECFMNVFGVGFDVETLKQLDMFRIKFTGLKAYVMAVKQALKHYRKTELNLSVDGKKFEKKELSVLSVGNGQYIGGGMKAVPHASPFDGKLNVVETYPVKKSSLLRLLPLFIIGYHTKTKYAWEYQCDSINLQGDNLRYQIDGEIRCASEIHIRIVHNQLKFRI